MYYVDSELMPIMVQELSAELDNSGSELAMFGMRCCMILVPCVEGELSASYGQEASQNG